MLEQAQRDYLTGFFVREALNPFLEKLILEANVSGKSFWVIVIDLDHFKKFNDKFGHIFGDEILKYVTSTLRLTFYKSQCYLFRYGGDEFVGAFPDTEPKEIFHLVQQCNYNLLHRPFLFQNKFYRITASCGIAGFPLDGKTSEELIQKADQAMYFSKRYGRNRATLANRMKYLKAHRIFLLICSICIVFYSLFVLYRLSFKKIIQPTIRQIQNIKITIKPKNLDAIILKNGLVFEGRILAETEDKVILNLYLEKGEGSATFNKAEIAKIKYGLRTSGEKH